MTLHTLVQYLGYRLRAKDRHGVHSPFVYEFNTKVLRTLKFGTSLDACTKTLKGASRLEALTQGIHGYYGLRSIHNSNEKEGNEVLEQDILILQEEYVALWLPMFNNDALRNANNSVFIFRGIHASKFHTKQWNILCQQPIVFTSIDLFEVGLLFFRDEFKERQHFVLKF